MKAHCDGPCVYTVEPEQAAIRFAIKMRCYLMDHQVPPEVKRRMMGAMRILESGNEQSAFEALGHLTLDQLKSRYVAHVVNREETMKAASRALAIDPATTWRILHRDRNGDGIELKSPDRRAPSSARSRKRRSHRR